MSMARTLAGILGLTLRAGCAIHTGEGPGETKTLRTPDSPEVAYQKVLQAVLQEGGAIQTAVEPKLISARFHNGVTLNVIINPMTGGGSSILTYAKLDAGKVAFGGVTVADTVLQRYHEVHP
jgi:hypothetical protein